MYICMYRYICIYIYMYITYVYIYIYIYTYMYIFILHMLYVCISFGAVRVGVELQLVDLPGAPRVVVVRDAPRRVVSGAHVLPDPWGAPDVGQVAHGGREASRDHGHEGLVPQPLHGVPDRPVPALERVPNRVGRPGGGDGRIDGRLEHAQAADLGVYLHNYIVMYIYIYTYI